MRIKSTSQTAKEELAKDPSTPVLIRLSDREIMALASQADIERDTRQRAAGELRRQYVIFRGEKCYVE